MRRGEPAPSFASMHSEPPMPTRSAFDLLGAFTFFLFAAGQIFQAYVMRLVPAADDLAANMRFDLSSMNQARLLVLFVGFFLFPAAYLAVAQRARGDAWTWLGFVWLLLFVTFELLNRGYEIGNLLPLERAWLATSDETVRTQLAARVTSYGQLQATATLLILPCYALGSAALAFAIGSGGSLLRRLARWGLALNAVRATLRFGALVLGIDFLAPVSEAIFFPVMIFQYVALGAWLVLPERR